MKLLCYCRWEVMSEAGELAAFFCFNYVPGVLHQNSWQKIKCFGCWVVYKCMVENIIDKTRKSDFSKILRMTSENEKKLFFKDSDDNLREREKVIFSKILRITSSCSVFPKPGVSTTVTQLGDWGKLWWWRYIYYDEVSVCHEKSSLSPVSLL